MDKKRDLMILFLLAVCQCLPVLATSAYRIDLSGLFDLGMVVCFFITGWAICWPSAGVFRAWSFVFASFIGLVAGFVIVHDVLFRFRVEDALESTAMVLGLTWPTLLCRHIFYPTPFQQTPQRPDVGALLVLGVAQILMVALFNGLPPNTTERTLFFFLVAFFVLRLIDAVKPTTIGNLTWKGCLVGLTASFLGELRSEYQLHLILALVWPALTAGLMPKRRPLGGCQPSPSSGACGGDHSGN